MIFRRLIVLLIAVATLLAPAGARTPAPVARHVVLISLDGLRPDAIDAAPAPTLQALIRAGTYCPVAQTIQPSITLPSHTSMLTGLDYPRHGVTWNVDHAGTIDHPTAMSVARKAGLSTAMLVAKSKFSYLAAPGSCDFTFGFSRDTDASSRSTADKLAAIFAREWRRKKFGFTFIHLSEPDDAGHRHRWMSAEYLAGVRAADSAVGAILGALAIKPGAAAPAKDVVVIVTSDHGGKDTTHVDRIPEIYTIPWICYGATIPRGLRIDRVVRTFDTMPTILKLLGVRAPDGLDGKPVEEVFASR